MYRSLGVVSDKIAQLSATSYKREILLLLLLLRRRRLLLLLLIIIMGDARGRAKVVANPGFGDRLRVSCVRACVVARNARSVAPCVAGDRWHRAWPAIDDDDDYY